MLAAITVGCARDPVTPSNISDEPHKLKPASDADSEPYRLWGEYSIYINDTHDQVEVVPKRQPRFHLNALKFLESYCTDCVKPLKMKNNGDGTVDLTIMIKHPFPGMPEYTAFDVKGIIMFNGSLKFSGSLSYPFPKHFYVSWKEKGDPEVLNPDGYAYRWSPVYESASDKPIFNYFQGKFSNGVPNAAINAYMNFYTQPERHIFRTDGAATRTYKIWLPPGEAVIAGYAVEACWEPPLKVPVTNPLEDFPITANQPEPYYYKVIVNNGEPINHEIECCGFDLDNPCKDLKQTVKEWDTDNNWMYTWYYADTGSGHTLAYWPCPYEIDSYTVSYIPGGSGPSSGMSLYKRPIGVYRDLATGFRPVSGKKHDIVFTVIDFIVY